jgi:Na+-transporting methylmalonyl-CoA/oxaloacetate decarboxylase gamma subunit
MNDPLIVSLVVTGIGMLALFVALTLLYGLMYLMTAVLKDRPEGKEEEEVERGVDEERARRRRAAVIGVALARAEREMSAPPVPEEEEAVSPWRALHHHRQLMGSLSIRRAR